jgi:hypothetical protein
LKLKIKTKYRNQFMQFALEVVVLEYSFLNHSQGIYGLMQSKGLQKNLKDGVVIIPFVDCLGDDHTCLLYLALAMNDPIQQGLSPTIAYGALMQVSAILQWWLGQWHLEFLLW